MANTYSDPTSAFDLLDTAFLIYCLEGELKYSFYCGITNDLERRRGEHNVEHYIQTVKMDSFELAKKVEAMMHDAGFDTGKQLSNGQEDPVYVYLYRKVPGVTIENPN